PALSQVPQVATNVSREQVGLKLTVTPHISEGDSVRLEIDESTEEVASNGELGPTTSTRAEKTQVIAKDRETVVLGGIMQDHTIETVSKVPVLGDLPIIGHLFRETTKNQV